MAKRRTKTKHKFKSWYCTTFRSQYFFAIGIPWDVTRKFILKNFGLETDEDIGADGATITVVGPQARVYIIWVKKKSDMVSLAHECIHASNQTLEFIGHKGDQLNDEVNAYLMSDLMERAIQK